MEFSGVKPEAQLFFEENFDQVLLTKYYGSDIGQDVKMPLHTIPTKKAKVAFKYLCKNIVSDRKIEGNNEQF